MSHGTKYSLAQLRQGTTTSSTYLNQTSILRHGGTKSICLERLYSGMHSICTDRVSWHFSNDRQSIATIKGDLSNITAPPFLLASQSTVEFPSYWAEHPSIFVAPASEPDPQKRALLVLRWFLAALKRQQYAGRDENAGVKKPLNAFLGELFFAQWQDQSGVTKLVSEQVR